MLCLRPCASLQWPSWVETQACIISSYESFPDTFQLTTLNQFWLSNYEFPFKAQKANSLCFIFVTKFFFFEGKLTPETFFFLLPSKRSNITWPGSISVVAYSCWQKWWNWITHYLSRYKYIDCAYCNLVWAFGRLGTEFSYLIWSKPAWVLLPSRHLTVLKVKSSSRFHAKSYKSRRSPSVLKRLGTIVNNMIPSLVRTLMRQIFLFKSVRRKTFSLWWSSNKEWHIMKPRDRNLMRRKWVTNHNNFLYDIVPNQTPSTKHCKILTFFFFERHIMQLGILVWYNARLPPSFWC